MGKVKRERRSRSKTRKKDRDDRSTKSSARGRKTMNRSKSKSSLRRHSKRDEDSLESEESSSSDESEYDEESSEESEDDSSDEERETRRKRRSSSKKRKKNKKKKRSKSRRKRKEVIEENSESDDDDDEESIVDNTRDRRRSSDVRLNEFNWRHTGESDDENNEEDENDSDDDDDDDDEEEEGNDDEGDQDAEEPQDKSIQQGSDARKRLSSVTQSEAERAVEADEKKRKLQKRTQVTVTKMLRAYMMKGCTLIGVYGIVMLTIGLVLMNFFSFSISVSTKAPLGLTLPQYCNIIGIAGILAGLCGVYMKVNACNPNHFLVLFYSIFRIVGTLVAFWAIASHVLVYELKPFLPDGIARHGERIMYFVTLMFLFYPVLAGPCYIRRFQAIWGAYQRSFDLRFFQLPPDTPTIRQRIARNTPPFVSRGIHFLRTAFPSRKELHANLKDKLRKSPEESPLLQSDLEAGPAHPPAFPGHMPPAGSPYLGYPAGLPPVRVPGHPSFALAAGYPSPLPAQLGAPGFVPGYGFPGGPASPMGPFHPHGFVPEPPHTARSHVSLQSQTANPGQPLAVAGEFVPPEPEHQPYFPARVVGLDSGAVISPDEFKLRWVSMPTTGSFKCTISATWGQAPGKADAASTPDADLVGKHMALRGFNFIASGFIPESNTLKCYFFGQYKGVCFLTEFAFQFAIRILRITFKCQEHDGAPHFVKLFELHELLGETQLVKDDQATSAGQQQRPSKLQQRAA